MQSVPAVLVAQQALAVPNDVLAQSFAANQKALNQSVQADDLQMIRRDLNQLRRDVDDLSDATRRLTVVVKSLESSLPKPPKE